MHTKRLINIFFFTTLFATTRLVSAASTPWIEIIPDQINGVYQSKGRVSPVAIFTLKALEDTAKNATLTYRFVWNQQKDFKQGEVTLKDGVATLAHVLPEPGCMILKLRSGEQKAEVGVVRDPFKIAPSQTEPKDFDAFWNKEKAALAKVPMNAQMTPVEAPRKANYGPEVECFDVKLDCSGGRPVYGYYARPKSAKRKSLPAYLSLHSAGIMDSSLPGAWLWAKRNHISLNINAHGLPNAQGKEFYSQMRDGELRGHRSRGLENPETYYFKGMYIRLIRAIDFLTAQPEWNGKVLIAGGASQGGGQSLIAGGIDSRVTEIRAIVPAFCDLNAPLGERKCGWPGRVAKTEPAKKSISYFDACYFASRFKGKADLLVGLVDPVCSPMGILAAFNQLGGEKNIIIQPTRGHNANPLSLKRKKDPVFSHP